MRNESQQIRFVEHADVLTAEQCMRVIETSGPRLAPSTVTGTPRYVHPARSSWECSPTEAELADLLDDAAQLESALLAATGLPPEHREPWRVLRYEPGQQYLAHHDWYPQSALHMLELGGQRSNTVMIYLCDVAVGGSTAFPKLARSFRAERGKLLAWNNVSPDGQRLQCALHAGLAPVSGNKWVLTSWYRESAYSGPRPPGVVS
jgi:prolyl 4-hydroxylase